jgi:hypothetical protein
VGNNGATEAARITTAGNVGIGTTTPGALLDVQSSNGAALLRVRDTDSTYGGLYLSGDTNGAYIGDSNIGVSTGESIYFQNSSNLTRFFISGTDEIRLSSTALSPSTNDGNALGSGTASWSDVFLASGGVMNFANSDVTLTHSSNTLTFDGAASGYIFSNGNIGIGTTTPNQKLSLYTAVASGDNAIEFSGASGSTYKWSLGMDNGTGAFKISSSSALGTNDRFVIDGNGFVGLNTGTPKARLTFANNLATGFLDNYSEYQVIFYDSGTAINTYGIGVKGNTMVFNSGTGAYSFDRAGSATTMTMDSSGNVGIGTTTPNQKLGIFASAADAAIELSTVSGSAEKWTIGIDDSDAAKFKISSSSALGTNDRFVIDGAGKVGINNASPAAQLDIVAGSASTKGLLLKGGASASMAEFYDSSNNLKALFSSAGSLNFSAVPATVGVAASSPATGFASNYWNGSASVAETIYIQNARYGGGGGSAGAYRLAIGSANPDNAALSIAGDGSNTVSVNYPYPQSATDAQFYVLNGNATRKGLLVKGIAGQSDSLLELQAYEGTTMFSSFSTSTAYTLGRSYFAGSVGVGTTTPNNKLTLFNSAAKTALEFSAASGATYKWTMGLDYTNGGKFKISSSSVLGTNDRFVIDGAGKIGINKSTPTAMFDVSVPTTFTSGSLQKIAASGATTLAGALTGVNLDLATNYTATGQSVTGYNVSLPSTNNSSGVSAHGGLTVNGGSLTSSGTGFATFTGLSVANPNITQTAGTAGAFGVNITTGSITTAGSQSGIVIGGSGVSAGTLTGIDIGAITAGAGTETALNIGSGWDNAISANGFTVNGSGTITAGTWSGTAIAETKGGTNQTTYATGDFLYASGANTLAKRTIGSTGQVLWVSGGVPAWTSTSSLNIAANVAIGSTITSATQGSVFFAGAAGALSQNNAQFFWNNTSNRLGLGTTTPNQKLALYTAVASGDNAIEFSGASGSTYKWSIGMDNGTGAFKISSSSVLGTNDRFIIDGNGRVGINTTPGSYQMNVGGSVNSSAYFLSAQGFYTGTTGNGINNALGGSTISFRTNSVENRMVIDASGNIGIGTTTPNQAFSIFRSANDAAIELSSASGSTYKWSMGIDYSDGAKFKISSSSVLGTNDRFVIDGSGRVGIGSSSPTHLLDISGNTAAVTTQLITNTYSTSGTNGGAVLGMYNGTNQFQIGKMNVNRTAYGALTANSGLIYNPDSAGIVIMNDNAAGTIRFATGGSSERMTITAAGNVGIGTTTPALAFQVGNAAAGSANIRSSGPTSDNNWGGGIELTSNNGTTVNAKINASTGGLFFNYGGSERMRIDSSGNVGIGNTSPSARLSVQGGSLSNGNEGTGAVNISGGLTTGRLQTYTAGYLGSVGTYHDASSLELSAGLSNGTGIVLNGQSATVAPGAIQFFSGNAGAIERMRLTPTGNFAIGTTSANQKLSIFNNANDAAIELSSASGANYKWAMGIDYSDGAKFKISSSSVLGTNDRFVINGNGKVGIGAASPGSKLTVGSGSILLATNNTSLLFTDTGGSQPAFTMQSDNNFVFYTTSSAGAQQAVWSSTARNTGSAIMSVSAAGGMIISGPVGIANAGVTSGFKLDVTGNMIFSAANPEIRLNSGGSWLYGASNTMYLGTNGTAGSAGALATFNNTGVGIGTSTPNTKLTVFNTSGTAQFRIAYNSTNYTDFTTSSAGDLNINPSGGDVGLDSENFNVCNGACASTPNGTGNITAEGSILSEEYNVGTTTGSVTINWDQGNQQRIGSSGNLTFSFSNQTNGQTLRLVVCYGGAHTVTWPAGIKWAGGSAPTPTSTNGKCDVFSFLYTNTQLFGQSSLNF